MGVPWQSERGQLTESAIGMYCSLQDRYYCASPMSPRVTRPVKSGNYMYGYIKKQRLQSGTSHTRSPQACACYEHSSRYQLLMATLCPCPIFLKEVSYPGSRLLVWDGHRSDREFYTLGRPVRGCAGNQSAIDGASFYMCSISNVTRPQVLPEANISKSMSSPDSSATFTWVRKTRAYYERIWTS